MIITNRQILRQLGYVDKPNHVLAIKLQCYTIIDISIYDHKYAMMTSCLYLALYSDSEYHVGILTILYYNNYCVCVHTCV